ncbi:hypothetical protein FNB15_02320 [Ferrovibrio terrae]|uniref:Uncharacterized protein n=1 Tax=Ferrovibrio terrae TaxID=2594003 RepID=A0A516GXA8_9PROT|nr:hypothetical protein [Ferrovibrio terrae]QDO96188.1 hypothetical protein FNB15_02320 [Ferrovibrio terrae]
MTDRLQRQWLIWYIALAIFAMFFAAGHIAGAKRAAVLTLQPHVETQLTVFSLLGHDIYFDLDFDRSAAKGDDDSLRSRELGGLRRSSSGAPLLMPGQPVVIEAVINDGLPLRLSATSANRFDRFVVSRSLRADGIVYASLASPAERDGVSALRARPGINRVSLRVLQVGGSLRGEVVELAAQPPLRAGATQPGYDGFVLVYWLLPVAMIGFIGSGILLVRRGAAQRQRNGS